MKKEILTTTDYEQFHRLSGNRSVTQNRVNKIINSIQLVGYITSPIIVNEKMEVVDGQGRLAALEQLKLPVEYIVVPGIGIKECISMNIDQTNWTLMDYIESYAEQGYDSYCKLLNLIKLYPDISLRAIYSSITGTASVSSKIIKNGSLEVTEENIQKSNEVLPYINKFEPYIKDVNAHKDILESSLSYAYWNENVNPDRMFERVAASIRNMTPYHNVAECLDALSEIYNYHIGKGKIYLRTDYQKMMDAKYGWYSNKYGVRGFDAEESDFK